MGIRDKIKNAEVSLWPFGMGMSIDEAINYLIAPKIASTEVTPEMQKQLDAHAIAIDTMRKYQKIEQIISDGYLQDKSSGEMLLDIKGVMNGNDD